jgi:O-antigen/teichoic acid export membrane protein
MTLFLVGVVPAAIAVIAAPSIFAVVFGREWIQAGRFAQSLVLASFLQMIVSPISQTLTIIDRQRLQAGWDALRLAIVIGALVVPKVFNLSVETAVLLYAAGTALAYALLFFLSSIAARKAFELPEQDVEGLLR